METPRDHQAAFYRDKLTYETDSSDLHRALLEDDAVVVVDGRSPDAYARERIVGAMNIPHTTISAQTVEHLDRTPVYVTYCDGIGCNASTKTASKLLEHGFRVKELLGGLDWWKRDGYATEGQDASSGTVGPACGCSG